MSKVCVPVFLVVCLISHLMDISSGHPLSLGAALGGKAVSVVKDNRQPNDGKGNYKYDIELSDGTKLKQEGKTEAPTAADKEGSLVVTGSYAYVAPDGSMVQVDYKADKNGYQPVIKTKGH